MKHFAGKMKRATGTHDEDVELLVKALKEDYGSRFDYVCETKTHIDNDGRWIAVIARLSS